MRRLDLNSILTALEQTFNGYAGNLSTLQGCSEGVLGRNGSRVQDQVPKRLRLFYPDQPAAEELQDR
jgi:hypothetical protein